MIRYTLCCDKEHEFESWFPNSDAYDKQRKRGLILCPACGSKKIAKTLMTPQLARKDRGIAAPTAQTVPEPSTPAPETSPVAMMSPQEVEFRSKLRELREHLTQNADNVGPKFPEEARKMHYGEVEHRSIFGQASPEEAKALHEEGIEFHPLPILPDERN
jgi:hypothetical protein